MAWNRPTSNTGNATSSSRPTGCGKVPRLYKGLLAGAIVVLGAGLAAWLLTNGEAASSPLQKKDRGLIKEVSPAVRKVAPKKREEAEHKAKVQTRDSRDGNYELQRPEVVKAVKPVDMAKYTNRVFNTTAEQLISWVVAIEPGDMPMPMPPLDQRDKENIASILISKSEIREGDSDYVKEVKASVDFAKKEMAKYIGDGGDPDEFLQYYQRELLKAYELRGDAFQTISKQMDEDPEVGKKMMDFVNKKFAAQGIKQFKMEEFE